LTAASTLLIFLLKAVPPTIEWTWLEATPTLKMGSDRWIVRTPQFTVQTLDAWTEEIAENRDKNWRTAAECMVKCFKGVKWSKKDSGMSTSRERFEKKYRKGQWWACSWNL
jgi:hypothetical protein